MNNKTGLANCYKIIKESYGTTRTARSGVPLINHIDEGLEILEALGACSYTKAAYCLHPLLQNDEDLGKSLISEWINDVPAKVLILAMEYRKTANAYLCRENTDSYTPSDVPEIPVREVGHMLVADKIQNQKDFHLYHFGTHDRSDQLTNYFKNWVSALAQRGFTENLDHSKLPESYGESLAELDCISDTFEDLFKGIRGLL